MLVRDIGCEQAAGRRRSVAVVEWEDNPFPPQEIWLELSDESGAETESADHFLPICFPLALLHGERRARIEAPLCPMLINGLHLVAAWWQRWGGLPAETPEIEAMASPRFRHDSSRKQALSFLSGGIDSLHLLLDNRRRYRGDEPGYVTDAVFVHGFDIGKRRRVAEQTRSDEAFEAIRPLADQVGVRLLRGSTSLRHLPSAPDFWNLRHSGAATAGFGHFAACGSRFVMMGGPTDIATLNPLGLHPAVDINYSSQRVTVVHEGARFSRLQKLRDLLDWPLALDGLRVCPADYASGLNCGECDKCLHTRLELLAVGCDYSAAFGELRMSTDLLEAGVEIVHPYQANNYRNALPGLRERGLDRLSRVIERKLQEYEGKPRTARSWVEPAAPA